jgi:error-prone DNA polymerase
VPMGEGQEVVEDYRATSLSLRAHPLAFLRDELSARKIQPCSATRTMKDGRWINLAGLVLVRQKPGSAKGVMFITIEDETDIANLVVWTSIFEKHRRIVLGASMLGLRGKVQREGEVVHVIVDRLDDLSPLLASVGSRQDVADVYRVAAPMSSNTAWAPILATRPSDPWARPRVTSTSPISGRLGNHSWPADRGHQDQAARFPLMRNGHWRDKPDVLS